MIEVAVIAVGVAVIWDQTLLALEDVRLSRQRVDRRWNHDPGRRWQW